MVTALGKKLSLRLFVLVRMDLKRLPEGNRLKRWKPGWVVSFKMFLALLRQWELWQMAVDDFFVRYLPPSVFSSCLPLCSWSATQSQHRSAGSRWWNGIRSPVAECLVAPS